MQNNFERIRALAMEIRKHRQLYYRGQPEISDESFDALEEELRRLDPEHPVLKEVGDAPQSNLPKVEHRTPMLSLNKTYKVEDLLSWASEEAIIGMPKIDGSSLSLIYEEGQLVLAKTRGNGRVGEDVTSKARLVPSIPRKLLRPLNIEVRGELYCSTEHFAKLCVEMDQRGLDRPMSPRNIVAGILGRKTDIDLAMYFDFYAFDMLVDQNVLKLKDESEKLDDLKAYGFQVPKYGFLQSPGEISHFLDEIQEMMAESLVSLDGAVFTYNNLQLHEELGATSHHPRYKMSFKWQGQTAVSQIREIKWATSRHGVVTPVAVIEPVELSSARITNITLHNAAMVASFNLKIGDAIEIVRSGEVIPKFLRVVEAHEGHYSWPERCPTCETLLEFDNVRLICPNRSGCEAQQIGQILNWIKAVEIDDLSEKRLEQMMTLGMVSEIPDLYKLTIEDLLQLPLTKEKMAQKLFNNIQKSKNLSLMSFLKGLGINGAGTTTWEKISAVYPTLKDIQAMSAEEIVKIDGFAEKSAEQIVSGLMEKEELITRLLASGVQPADAVVNVGGGVGALSGLQFVITGALSRPRQEIEADIKRAGGKVVGSVSKNTSALITNETDSTSSKMKKAKDLGIAIWSEKELEEKLP